MVNILDYAKEAVIEKVFSFNILFKKILKYFSLPSIKYEFTAVKYISEQKIMLNNHLEGNILLV